jgi:hypothetical protein
MIRRIFQWLLEIWRWLAEGKIIFMCLLVIAAAVTLGMFAWRSETSIRLSGYALQLIGMVFAIRGLIHVRIHFGQPSLSHLFVQWLKRFPKWKRDMVIGVGAANMPMAGMRARAEVWNPDNSDLSVEKRIEGIVKNLEMLRGEQSHLATLLEKLRNDHEEHKKSVSEQSKKLERDIRLDFRPLSERTRVDT